MSEVQALEPRQLLSVSHDAEGFSVIRPPAGATVIYVSSASGRDSNSGQSPSSPLKTISRAKKLLRSGRGDQMLLKRGDVFREAIGFWSVSGRSSVDPAVIGAYGSGERPVIFSGRNIAFRTSYSGVRDVAIIGVHFDGDGRGAAKPDGIVSTGKTSNFLIEDCEIEGYRNNLTFQSFLGSINNVTVRRSIVADAWSRGSHAQGIYADGVRGITLEENTFDHNGWGHGAGATMFNHGAYITAESTGLTARGNIFSNSSSHGLQARSGGTVVDNVFINNAVGLTFGLVNGGGVVTPGGVTGVVSNNVFTGGHAIGSLMAGVGLEVSNIRSAVVSDNLIFNGNGAANPAISVANISGTSNASQAVGINNLSIQNNVVYNWGVGIRISSGMRIRGMEVKGNDFQSIRRFQAVQNRPGNGGQSWYGNTYYVPGNSRTPVINGSRALTVSGFRQVDSGGRETRVNYPDAGRTVSRYAGDFLSRARHRLAGAWDARYAARALVGYLRGGFRGGRSGATPVLSAPRPAVNLTASGASNGSSVKAESSASARSSPSSSAAAAGSLPRAAVNDVRTREGDRGWSRVTWTIRLDRRPTRTAVVRWETKGRTARVGSDYIGRHGSVSFKPGQTTRTVSIRVRGDEAREPHETFVLNLLGATNAVIADSQGQATIINDD